MDILNNINELKESKMTLVSMENVINFVRACAAIGIVTYGGAFCNGFTSQWFYCE